MTQDNTNQTNPSSQESALDPLRQKEVLAALAAKREKIFAQQPSLREFAAMIKEAEVELEDLEVEEEIELEPETEQEWEEATQQRIPVVITARKKSGRIFDPNGFKPFLPANNLLELFESIDKIPAEIALVPLRDKSPIFAKDPNNYGSYPDWTKVVAGEENRELIKRHIAGTPSLKALIKEKKESYTPDEVYKCYSSGVGMVTGDASGGIFALDVDGSSADVWLNALSSGDLPKTVSFTSGKPGRRQLLYKVPEDLKATLGAKLTDVDFGVKKVRDVDDIPGKAMGLLDPQIGRSEQDLIAEAKEGKCNRYYQCAKDESGRYTEALEVRYNGLQSCLPPSRHPQTGRYQWINSFEDCAVAEMPQWLIRLVSAWIENIEREQTEKKERALQAQERRGLALASRKVSGEFTECKTLEDALAVTYEILGFEGVYNWVGHNWTEERGEWTHGYCPQHASTSGTSFAVNPESGSFICHGCNDAKGSFVGYRSFREGGDPKPRGSEFMKYARELFKEAGVTLSVHKRKQQGEITKEEYEARNLKPELTELEKRDQTVDLVAYSAAKDAQQEREFIAYQERLKIDKTKVAKYYECNERYLSDETFAQFPSITACEEKGQMLGLKAPKGTGKSRRIDEYIKLAKQACWLTISVTPRVNLGVAQAAEWQIPWISDDGFEVFVNDEKNQMSCCWDSLHKLSRKDYRDKKILFIVDEIESGLEHLCTSGTFKGKGTRSAVFFQLRRLLDHIQQYGGLVIGADADLTCISLDFVKDVNPQLPITLIENHHVIEKKEIEVFFNKDGNVKAAIKMDIDDLNPIIVACDSKEDVKDLAGHALENLRPELKDKVWEIHAENINEDANQRRIKNFNKALLEEKPLAVFFSPTITVGISIDIEYFTQGYGNFKGSVTADVARQMVARNREIIPWMIFADNLCDRRGDNTPITPETVKGKIVSQIKAQANLTQWMTEKLLKEDREEFNDDEEELTAQLNLIKTLREETRSLETAEFHLLGDILAKQNFQKKYFHKCFVKGMDSEGWKVTSKRGEKTAFSEELKEKREERHKKESEEIASADHTHITSVEEAQDILNTSTKRVERVAAEKVVLANKARLKPEEMDAEITQNLKFNRRYLPGIKREWYIQNSHVSERVDGRRMAKLVKDLVDMGIASTQDATGESVWVNEVIKLGIFDIIDLDDDERDYKREDFQPIIDKLKFLSNKNLEAWAERCEINWNQEDHKRSGLLNNPVGRIVKPILEKLGYNFVQAKKNKKGLNSYKIPAEQINDPIRAKIKLAMTRDEAERQAQKELQMSEQSLSIVNKAGCTSVPFEQVLA